MKKIKLKIDFTNGIAVIYLIPAIYYEQTESYGPTLPEILLKFPELEEYAKIAVFTIELIDDLELSNIASTYKN